MYLPINYQLVAFTLHRLLFHTTSSIYYWFQDSRIMKSAMDGSNETVLVTHGLRHPISITVDEWSQKLYWLDSDLGEIECVQFNGLNRKVSDESNSFVSWLISY